MSVPTVGAIFWGIQDRDAFLAARLAEAGADMDVLIRHRYRKKNATFQNQGFRLKPHIPHAAYSGPSTIILFGLNV